jgi:tetratricopeptide (TPR) repeat protein
MYKKVLTALIIFILGVVIFIFVFTDSYKLSIKARMKYMTGEYKEARALARKAFELDPYNKMAFSIVAQSKIAVKMQDYILDADKYIKRVEELSLKGDFSNSDHIKIKYYCEIMIEKYKKLNPTVMTDKDLYEACTLKYKKFQQIYDELF